MIIQNFLKTDQIELYSADTIHSVDWTILKPAAAKEFLIPLIQNGVHTYVNNIHASVFALRVNDLIFPVIVTESGKKNSYICSPYEHYFAYGKEALNLIGNRFLEFFAGGFLQGLGKISQMAGIDAVVYVNHWLFSTDLYPEGLDKQHIEAIVEFLSRVFPQHVIIFRSLNPISTAPLMESFKDVGFKLLASRYVFFTDTKKESIFRTRIIKSDMKLHHETDYEILDESQLSSEDCERLLDLYKSLYIEHHSTRNPQYDLSFVKLLFERKLLHFIAIRKEGQFKGVAGYYERNGVMMCPFFGFNKDESDHAMVYRLLSTSLLLTAQKRQALFHQSAGAAFYKTIRRSEGCLEWMAIYFKHLSYARRFSWSTLSLFINGFAAPYMKRY